MLTWSNKLIDEFINKKNSFSFVNINTSIHTKEYCIKRLNIYKSIIKSLEELIPKLQEIENNYFPQNNGCIPGQICSISGGKRTITKKSPLKIRH